MRAVDRRRVEKGRGAASNPAGRFESLASVAADDGWGCFEEFDVPRDPRCPACAP